MPGITAAMITAGASIYGTNKNNAASASNATTAYNRTMALDQYVATHNAPWAVQGYENAGINPILAAGGGFGTGPTQVAPTAQLALSQIPQGVASAVQAYDTVEKTQPSVQLTGAQTTATEQQGNKAAGDTLAPGTAEAQAQAGTKNLQSSAAQADASSNELRAKVDEIHAQIDNIKQQTQAGQIDNQTRQQLNQLKVGLDQTQLQLERLGVRIKGTEADAADQVKAGLDAINKAKKPAADAIGQTLTDASDFLDSVNSYMNKGGIGGMASSYIVNKVGGVWDAMTNTHTPNAPGKEGKY